MSWGRVLVCLAVLALAHPAAALAGAPPLTFDSGSLQLRVTQDPFTLEFVDHRDGEVLRTAGAALPAPNDPRARYGPLGYSFDLREPVVNNAYLGYYVAAEVETLWFHARRIAAAHREGSALILDAETNDPLGHRLLIRVSPAGDGGLTVDSRIAPGSGPLAAQASLGGAAFQPAAGERYLGFGERSNAVDQTGHRVFSWAEEGPFSSGDYDQYIRPLLPDFTFPTGPTATNFPIPWLVSTRGFGFLIDQTERSTFRLLDERPDLWHAESESSHFRFTVFGGPRPADVVRRYSAYAGRQPGPAPWILGPWVQFAGDWPERFRAQDVPTSVAQTYTHYLPCGAQRGRETAEQALVDRFHRLGYQVTTYFNPHVCTSYQPVYGDAAARGLLVKNAAGQPYVLSNPFTADQQVSEVDFTHPDARRFFGHLLDEALARGYDGWMEDFGEYTPTDSLFADGRRGLEMHNLYPVLYHRASTDHTGGRHGHELAVFIRSGFHGVQPHARVVWGGDPTEDWSCSDGLCAAVHQALAIGLSGVAYWGSDIGGFHSIANPRTSDELNARWLEFGAVSGVMRTQANGFSFRGDRAARSQVWSPAVLPIWRRYAKLRTQLYPYLASASDEYQHTGLPLMRHLSLAYPSDPRALLQQTEFLLGAHLLAAPVIQPGARTRTLYLPPGDWVDLWRSVRYRPGSGELRLGAARVLSGGHDVTVPAPLDELPLLARTGTILALLPPDVDTLAERGHSAGLVHAGDRRDSRNVIVFPRGNSQARLPGGDSITSDELSGRRWQLRLRARRTTRYSIEAALGTLSRPFAPCSVTLDGRVLARRDWHYTAADRVLHAQVRTRSGRLIVSAACPPLSLREGGRRRRRAD